MSLSAITVYDNGFLPNNAFSRIHGLNFVGAGVTVEVPAIHFIEDVGIATIRVNFSNIPNDVNISGVVTATAFVGDGSGLTGVVGTGSGVEIQENGSPVGTAATINFRDNLSVDFSGGVATINNELSGISTDSEKLNGEDPSYYLDYNNLTNTPVNLSDFNNDVGFTTFSGDYNDLTNTPVNLSDFNNDVGFTTFSGDYNDLTNTPVNLSDFNNDVGFTTFSPSGRISITQTTNTLGIGETANITFSSGLSEYKLLKASTSDGAWVTIYTDTQSRTDDINRSIDTDPLPGSGVIAELITTGTGITTQRFTPGVVGYNDDEEISNNIYAKVVNNSGISTEITVTLTIAD
jgi:hypothetical protein